MNNVYYGKLVFELSKPGRKGYSLPANEFAAYALDALPVARRERKTLLPEVDELTVARHYTNMSNNNFGVDTGFYPLGSCTMKYNPKVNEEMAALPGFNVHPATPDCCAQGALKLYDEVQRTLAEISGLSRFTLNPYAGAHGELTGLMVIGTYHRQRGDVNRKKIIVPDSAHGTNPASAAVAGFQIVQVKSTAQGTVDVEDLKPLLGPDVAGMMMTNPNTLGLFETQIPEIARLVHECGGLMYYDGANLNPMLGVCRPGDMGFDVMHINLHKTFSTPHGGGGPGSGPVGVKKHLMPFMPVPVLVERNGMIELDYDRPESFGRVKSFYGNFGVIVKAYAYIRSLGGKGLKEASENAVLNANYIMNALRGTYEIPHDRICMHECVIAPGELLDLGVHTTDIAKALIDRGYHPPTIYFPLIVHEAMMIEPTETESRETLDEFIEAMKDIAREAKENPEAVHACPVTTPVGRPDEVTAARKPVVRYTK